MGKYSLLTDFRLDEVESDFLPRKGDAVIYEGKTYYVESILHKIFEKEGRLEARVEVKVIG